MVEEAVPADVDHAKLNADVSWLDGVIPTAENLSVMIWRRLKRCCRWACRSA